MDAHGTTTWLPEQQELLHIFCHDTVGPLVAIRGLANLLKEPLTPERREEAVRVIVCQVDNMFALLDRLRNIIDDGDLDEQHPVSIDASEMMFIVKVACTAATKGSEDARRLHTRVELDEAVVLRDLLRVRRILTNLITNAIGHTEGPVEVYVRGGHRLLLEVCDRGTGLQDRSHSHSGLGIRIVKDLVTSLGGEAAWDTRPGGGLIARVTLPL